MIPVDFLKIVDTYVDIDTNGSTLQKILHFQQKNIENYVYFLSFGITPKKLDFYLKKKAEIYFFLNTNQLILKA